MVTAIFNCLIRKFFLADTLLSITEILLNHSSKLNVKAKKLTVFAKHEIIKACCKCHFEAKGMLHVTCMPDGPGM